MKVNKEEIEPFIRVRVAQGFTDREIASQYGTVGISTIAHWRNRFNIRPADKFLRNFTKKYGDGAPERFHALAERGVSLKKIGDVFGFGCEYARQVHLKLYGRGVKDKRCSDAIANQKDGIRTI